jgi:putative endonuclease
MKHVRMQRGAAAEELAAQYLQVRGLKILARNMRCRAGELDLVCLDNGVLAIVEVRQRASTEFGGALGSVTWGKQFNFFCGRRSSGGICRCGSMCWR